jgi:hypothetical protein
MGSLTNARDEKFLEQSCGFHSLIKADNGAILSRKRKLLKTNSVRPIDTGEQRGRFSNGYALPKRS